MSETPDTLETDSLVALADDSKTAEAAASALRSALPDVRVEAVSDADDDALRAAPVVVAFHPPAGWVETAESVGWVHAATAGVDGYPVDRFAERGVVLTNGRGVTAEPVAEQALAALLAFDRRVHRAVRQQARGEWTWFGGHELRGKTVGVVGVGAIGRRVATLCSAFDTTVLGVKRDTDVAVDGVDELFVPDDLDAVLERAEHLVLSCPLTDETRGLIGGDECERLPDHAVVVNVARGEVVDEDALLAALDADEIRGAALDVFETEPLPPESPLWEREDVILTPHMAGSTPAFWERNAALVGENYPKFERGEPGEMENRVV